MIHPILPLLPAAVADAEAAVLQVIRSWAPDQYADPTATASDAGAALGRRLASALAATQGLYVFDHRAKVLMFVSEGVSRLLGYPVSAFQTISFFYDLTHPDGPRRRHAGHGVV